jgi:NAD(P)-dependent dehydrogenase (short-subunit alcohol dehydrogenase family)
MAIPDIPNPYHEFHLEPKGPGDARPTAFQIIKDNDLIGKLKDKTILITGGTAGLGRETVMQLAKTGAQIYFTARNAEKAESVLQDIAKAAADGDKDLEDAQVDWLKMNNMSLKSVREAAQDFLRKSPRLDVLINNAGTSSKPYALTEDGFEEQFGVNHLAHFLLFNLLKDVMIRSSTPTFNSRVVAVSSQAHTFSTVQFGNYNLDRPPQETVSPITEMEGDRNPMVLYGQSKTAIIWFANHVERLYGGQGLHGLSVHPGTIVSLDSCRRRLIILIDLLFS